MNSAVCNILFESAQKGPERTKKSYPRREEWGEVGWEGGGGKGGGGGVHRTHTRSVHHEHYSLLTSTNMKCVLVAQDVMSCSIFVRMKIVGHPVDNVIPLLVSNLTFSLPVHQNTKHHLDSTTFSKTTLYTQHLFQNLHSRQAALKNRSRK